MKFTGMKIFSTLVIIAVIMVAIGGAYLAGSPASVRKTSLDNRRVSDLQSITYAVENFWRVQKKFPASLDELKKTRDVYIGSVQDPETFAEYEYQVTGGMTYQLCAIFSMPTETRTEKGSPIYAYPYQGSEFWNHPAGRFCYSLEVRPDPNAVPVK